LVETRGKRSETLKEGGGSMTIDLRLKTQCFREDVEGGGFVGLYPKAVKLGHFEKGT